MNKTLKQIVAINLVSFCLLITSNGFSQPTFVSPSNSDFQFATLNYVPTWMNDAEIKVASNNFTAVTWEENGTVYVRACKNTTLGNTQTVAVPTIDYSGVRNPDVVLGTDNAGTILCGVVYSAIGINPVLDDVWMDLYTVNTANANLAYQCSRQISNTGSGVGNAHIDLINKYAYPAAITRSDFVIAWEEGDDAVGGYYGVEACAGQLVNFCNPNGITYSGRINAAGIAGAMVDVAGIERFIAGPNVVRNIALFAYVDPNNNNTLEYNEWEIPTNTIAGESAMDANANGLEYPRIDAVDPNTENANNGDALYTVGYRYYNTGNASWEIKQMNNVNFGTGDVITSYYNPTDISDNYTPVVACFGTKWNFDVSYATSIIPATSSSYTLSEEVAKSGGAPGDILSTPSTPIIYIANTTANSTGICAPVAIASAWAYTGAVQIPSNQFVCWINAGNSSSYVIDCKSSGGTISYKPTWVQEAITNKSWSVWPNPAGDVLSVDKEQASGARYSISDILGRVQMEGTLKDKNRLNVVGLSKGIYILAIYNADKTQQKVEFVKQ